MSNRPANARKAILAAVISALPIATSFAQTSGSYIGPSGYSWNLATNWSGAIPNAGGSATLTRNSNQLSTLAVVLDIPVTLSNLNYFQRNTTFVQEPTGGTNILTLSGASNINSTNDYYRPTPTAFAAVGHRVSVFLGGTSGLNKNGGGVWVNQSNTALSGNTVVNGGLLSVTGDTALGSSTGGVITFNGTDCALQAVNSAFTTTRSVVLNSDVQLFNLANMDFGAPISGTGGIYKSPFYSSSVTLRAANTFSGPLVIAQGSVTLTSSGTVAPSSIVAGGTLDIADTSGPTSNRVTNAAPLTLRGGILSYRANAGGTSTQETFGALTLSGGQSQLLLSTNATSNIQANFASLARQNRGIFFARGGNLGNAPANGVGNVKFTAAPATIGGGGAAGSFNRSILPYGYGVQGPSLTTTDANTAFLVNGTDGLRPLDLTTEVRTTMASVAAPDENVRLTAADSIAADTTVNSLQLNGGTLTGAATLTVTSGGILAGGGVTSQIDTNLNFGAAEGIMMCPSQLNVTGAISGSNGLTVGGGNLTILNSTASTYTGQTTITNGFVVFGGDVPAAGPSALGSGGAIVFAPGSAGVSRGAFYADAVANGTVTIARNIEIKGDPTGGSPGRGCIGTNGDDAGESIDITGNVFINGGILSFEGDNTGTIGISGVISGSGMVTDTAFATPSASTQAFRNANTYTGGTEIRDGIYLAGNNQAFGTGTIWFANSTLPASGMTLNSAIGAVGGARTISNYIEMRSSLSTATQTFNGVMFAGDSPLTLNGTIDLGDTNARLINIGGPTPQNIDFAGTINYGGITKQGAGTLILSGNGLFGGQVQANEGAIVLKSSTALGANNIFALLGDANGFFPNFARNTGYFVIDGSSGNLNLGAESIVLSTLSSSGAAIRNIAGNNTITGALYISSGDHSVDISAGSSFTSQLRDNSGTLADASITKIGGGQLNVDRLRMNTANINDGTVRLTGSGTLGQGKMANLNLAAGTTLDIGNTGMIVTTTPAATIKSAIVSGRNGGAWNGTGIRTSSAVTSGNKTGIGYNDGASVVNPQAVVGEYQGQTVAATDMVFAHVYLGDVNLDRVVNSLDFAASFGTAGNYGMTSGADWRNGDFNYDGKVNTQDFNEMAGNFGLTLAGPLPGSGLGLDTTALLQDGRPALVMPDQAAGEQFAKDSLELVDLRQNLRNPNVGIGSVVPEPGSLSVIIGSASALLIRRRRQA